MVRRISLVLALALVALLAGCKSKDQAPAAAATTPEGAVQAAVASLKAGDLAALVQAQVPPQHMDTLRAEWKRDMAEDVPSDEDRQQFAQMMADLTAPDADERLFLNAFRSNRYAQARSEPGDRIYDGCAFGVFEHG